MKILLADDHPLMREGVRHVLVLLEAGVEIIDAHDYPSLFGQARTHADLDLALVDLNMPGSPGLAGIGEFRARFPVIPLVVLSASESARDIQAVLDAGALGYIPKASPQAEMLAALHCVLDGDVYVPPLLHDAHPGLHASAVAGLSALAQTGLTTRQTEVLRLLLKGTPNKVIARTLHLTEGTIKIHVAAIFRALKVNNRTEAVLAVKQLGIDPYTLAPAPA
jgi:DNA-binding NarL/FixJ family response regulator